MRMAATGIVSSGAKAYILHSNILYIFFYLVCFRIILPAFGCVVVVVVEAAGVRFVGATGHAADDRRTASLHRPTGLRGSAVAAMTRLGFAANQLAGRLYMYIYKEAGI